MPNYLLTCGRVDGFVLIGTSTTNYFALCGSLFQKSTEAHSQNRARSAYTLSDLLVRITVNGITAVTTVRSRVAGANGNQSVSIGSGATGKFEDTINTDSISSAALANSQVVTGSTGTDITISLISYTLEDASTTTYILSANGLSSDLRNVIRFIPINGDVNSNTTESFGQFRIRIATTFSNLRIFVVTNGVSDPSTLTFRADGASGNQSVSITASTSGEFEDTTNTDVISANTLINTRIDIGQGAHSDANIVFSQIQLKGDAVDRITMGGATGQFFVTDGLTLFATLEDEPEETSTESDAQVDVRIAYDVQNLFARSSANSLNAATTLALRVGGVTSSILTVSIAASTSGEFEDTTGIVSLAATDEINSIVDASASTSGSLNIRVLSYQIGESPAAPPSPLPEGLQATQPIMVLRPRRG